MKPSDIFDAGGKADRMDSAAMFAWPFPEAQRLKTISVLPNPFEFYDGSCVKNRQDWEKRRQELAVLAQYYVFGWVQRPESLSYRVNENDGVKSTLTVTVWADGREASFSVAVAVPRQGVDTPIPVPYPVLIVVGALGSDAQRTELLKNGYAVIEMPPHPIYSDDATRRGAYTTLFPYRQGEVLSDSGALMAWAWGVSRIIDALDLGAYPAINPRQTIVTGVSRYGKAALLASAFDRRVAVSVPVDTGQAGASSFRYNVEGRIYPFPGDPFPEGMGRSEKIRNMTGGLSHWFSSRIAEFENREAQLPFDAHCILALVAPRPLLIFAGDAFDWLSAPSTVLSYTAAHEVYEFLGANEAIALNVRSGPHAIQDHDIAIIIDFANHALRGSDYRVSKDIFPFVDTYHAYRYLPDTAYLPWSRPGKHTLWTESEHFLAGMPWTLTVYSNANTVTLTPPATGRDRVEPLIESVVDGQAVFQLSADQARIGIYRLRADGRLDRRTIQVLGVAWDDAAKITLTAEGSHRIIHFADRYDHSAVRVVVNGVDVTDVYDPVRFPEENHRQVYCMAYGIRISGLFELAANAEGAYHLVVEHLQFKNFWPERTFQWSQTVSAPVPLSVSAGTPVLLTNGLATGLRIEA